MEYIAGYRGEVDADLRAAGFQRVGADMYCKGSRRIRWVSGVEKIRGIDGDHRAFILRKPFDLEMHREAIARRFNVVTEI